MIFHPKKSERGSTLGPLLLVSVGVLIGLGLAAILYRSGMNAAGAAVYTPDGYLEAKPVVNMKPTNAVDDRTQNDIVSAIRKVQPAVVNIDVTTQYNDGNDIPPMFRDLIPMPKDRNHQERQGEGSGIIINGPQGLVLTNNHVVRGATKIRVQLKDGQHFTGKVLGVDPFSDVALVKIPGGNLPTAVLGASKQLPVGSWSIAIGNPLGFQHTVTVGVISAYGRDLPAPNGLPLEDLIQTDAAINPGNSGGALCDINGNVIGMNTAIIPTAQGIGFAVSVETVKYVVGELLKNGRVTRSWMGLSFATMDEDLAEQKRIKFIPGVYIDHVRQGQPAEKAGLRSRDIITAVENKPVREADEVRAMVRRRKPGDTVTFLVSRNGQAMTFTVTLGKMPSVEELTQQGP